MKLKLDENIDLRILSLLQFAGHDLATIPEEGLNSAPDPEIIDVCFRESRCLVTCDRGFGNRLRYNPDNYSGIVIIRLPSHYTFADWSEAVGTLIVGLESANVIGKLWIIQKEKIWVYQGIEQNEHD